MDGCGFWGIFGLGYRSNIRACFVCVCVGCFSLASALALSHSHALLKEQTVVPKPPTPFRAFEASGLWVPGPLCVIPGSPKTLNPGFRVYSRVLGFGFWVLGLGIRFGGR